MAEISARPMPEPSALTQAYWDGIAAGEIRLQCCDGCGALRHYPRLLCNRCYSDTYHWIAASGRGHVQSWTVAHHPYHAAFVTEVPFTLVIVDLEEGPRAMGRWRGNTPHIGQRVIGRVLARDGGADLHFEAAAD